MANVLIEEISLTNIANAIRAKNGLSTTYKVSEMPSAINAISGGGGAAPKKQINFIDYDGTILHSYTKSEWQGVSSLPSNPSHTGLTAQGWNWTKSQIDSQLTAVPDGDIWIGQMYITTSGDTEIDVVLSKGRINPYLNLAVNGTVVIDWGDGSATSTVTGTSYTTQKRTLHYYPAAGSYTITISVSSGSFAFYGTSTESLLSKGSSPTAVNAAYSNSVQRVRLGSGVTNIGMYAFANCYSLASITIPSGVTSISTYAFRYCYSLASINIPNGVTSIGDNAFGYCYSLASISIPSRVTRIGTYAFSYCQSLASITIPSGVTTISTYAFSYCQSLASISIPSRVTSISSSTFANCYSLASITIPNGVTSIGNNAFSNCYGMAEYHLLRTSPPTLSNTNAFSNIQPDCKMYVPSGSLSAYQSASYWSTYSSYMVGV